MVLGAPGNPFQSGSSLGHPVTSEVDSAVYSRAKEAQEMTIRPDAEELRTRGSCLVRLVGLLG